jgi:poly(hydroxyalkanoate) depolymerase family esterase
MDLVDWRKLYADNQAVIRDGLRPRGLGSAAPRANRVETGLLRPHVKGPRLEALDRGSGGRARALESPVVHRPEALDPTVPAPLLVILHGCTQSAGNLAADTGLNALADRHGFVVAYPEQAASRNARRCWNWFESGHQVRGRGEPAMLADTVARLGGGVEGQAIDRDRVLLAGFSAGGAMACVLAAAYPELLAGLAVHSGLAYGCATGLPAALQAMRRGAGDAARLGPAARAEMGRRAGPLPTIVVHGTADRIVHPVNGGQVAAQWLHANGLDGEPEPDPEPEPDAEPEPYPDTRVSGRADAGLAYSRRRWSGPAGRPVVELLTVKGLGHAWSGGAARGAYADPRGPSANDAIWRFFEDAGALGA